MKQIICYIIGLGCFILTACQQEATPEAVGYLEMASLRKAIVTQTTVNARAVGEVDATEIWYISLTNENNEKVVADQEINAATGKIELPAGTYTVELKNASYKNGGSNQAKYYLRQEGLEIVTGQVTYPAYTVPMVNFAVTLRLPDGFDTYFQEAVLQVKALYTGGKSAVTLNANNGESVYFDNDGIDYLECVLGALNQDNESVTTMCTVTNIEPAKNYIITYALPESLSDASFAMPTLLAMDRWQTHNLTIQQEEIIE